LTIQATDSTGQSVQSSFLVIVNQATLTYTANPVTRPYGAANPGFSGTVTGFVNGDTQATATTGTLSFTATATAASGAGSYPINGGGLSASNYTFVQAASNATVLTITPRVITVTAKVNSKTYDGTTSASATPIITGGSLLSGATATFTEAY